MTQNDKRNAKISEVCRVLANACMSENTSLYPEDIMTFVNESRNSDVRELLALHTMLNESDAIRTLEKNIECAEAWDALKQRYNADMAISLLQVKIDHNNSIIEARHKEKRDFEKGFTYLESADSLALEYEIEEYEKLLESERELKESFGIETDNDIAVKTAAEIIEENARREHQLSEIACNAVSERVHCATIIRFMRTMCKDDNERVFFLTEYANAQWRDGYSF